MVVFSILLSNNPCRGSVQIRVEFSRPLRASDRFDNPWIVSRARPITWAMGPLSEASTAATPIVLYHLINVSNSLPSRCRVQLNAQSFGSRRWSSDDPERHFACSPASPTGGAWHGGAAATRHHAHGAAHCVPGLLLLVMRRIT